MPKSLVQSLISQLQQERARLDNELHRVTAALSAFSSVYIQGRKAQGKKARGRKAKSAPVPRKHKISAAGRRRIAAAQKARWAKARAAARKTK